MFDDFYHLKHVDAIFERVFGPDARSERHRLPAQDAICSAPMTTSRWSARPTCATASTRSRPHAHADQILRGSNMIVTARERGRDRRACCAASPMANGSCYVADLAVHDERTSARVSARGCSMQLQGRSSARPAWASCSSLIPRLSDVLRRRHRHGRDAGLLYIDREIRSMKIAEAGHPDRAGARQFRA